MIVEAEDIEIQSTLKDLILNALHDHLSILDCLVPDDGTSIQWRIAVLCLLKWTKYLFYDIRDRFTITKVRMHRIFCGTCFSSCSNSIWRSKLMRII